MNKKLLTDQSLRDDIYCQMMFIAGGIAFYGISTDRVRTLVEDQIDLLMPVIKKHVKRHVKATKENKKEDLK